MYEPRETEISPEEVTVEHGNETTKCSIIFNGVSFSYRYSGYFDDVTEDPDDEEGMSYEECKALMIEEFIAYVLEEDKKLWNQ